MWFESSFVSTVNLKKVAEIPDTLNFS